LSCGGANMQLRQEFRQTLPARKAEHSITAGLFSMPGWSDSNSGMCKERNPLAAISRRSSDDPSAANPATALLTLRWTFGAKRASVVVVDAEPDRLAPLPRQRRWASAGFGWWRRDLAPTRLRGVLACPSASVRESQRDTAARHDVGRARGASARRIARAVL
jgi:hypothetical protein